jgi:hypothetical protein
MCPIPTAYHKWQEARRRRNGDRPHPSADWAKGRGDCLGLMVQACLPLLVVPPIYLFDSHPRYLFGAGFAGSDLSVFSVPPRPATAVLLNLVPWTNPDRHQSFISGW